MKAASCILKGQPIYGLIKDAGFYTVLSSFASRFPRLRDVLEADAMAGLGQNCADNPVAISDIVILPPIPNPRKIICVGLNYKKPYPVPGVELESDNIVLFGRNIDTFVGHESALEMPSGEAGDSYDFEGEIAAVIGTHCRNITADQALAHVAGYACMNEGSVRTWQKHSVYAGKNFVASGGWGPWLVTADEAGSVSDMNLVTRVNGKDMQASKGAQMIHSLDKVISYISEIMPLDPGDVIATGSPDGTGGSRNPTAFLVPGDQVEVEISGIGTLRNIVKSSQS